MLSGASPTSLYGHHVSTYGLSSEVVKEKTAPPSKVSSFSKTAPLFKSGTILAPTWHCFKKTVSLWSRFGSTLERFWLHCGAVFNLFFVENGTTLQSGIKTVPNGGHPVDMKTAPPWSHFGYTFFFQCTIIHFTLHALDFMFTRHL